MCRPGPGQTESGRRGPNLMGPVVPRASVCVGRDGDGPEVAMLQSSGVGGTWQSPSPRRCMHKSTYVILECHIPWMLVINGHVLRNQIQLVVVLFPSLLLLRCCLNVLPIPIGLLGDPFRRLGAQIQTLREMCSRNHVSVHHRNTISQAGVGYHFRSPSGAVWNSGSVPENPMLTNAHQATSRIHVLQAAARIEALEIRCPRI
jgi:hypothetical protein